MSESLNSPVSQSLSPVWSPLGEHPHRRPPEGDRWRSKHAVIDTTPWPTTQVSIAKLMDAGMQKGFEFELALGHNVGTIG